MPIDFQNQSLIPAVIQDASTHRVLMLGYVSRESLEKTFETEQVWFYSRSRQELWHKGATSGSYLNLKAAWIDCDGDAILFQVQPTGPVCHTGEESCFFQPLDAQDLKDSARTDEPTASWGETLEELWKVILERKETMPQGSYVASLFEKGIDQIGKKVIEEAGEAAIAAKNPPSERVVSEVADLWFHSLVLLAARGLTPRDVWHELKKRRR